MQATIRDWLIQAGFPEEIELSSLGGGMGSTSLWTFTPAPHASPLVVRVFKDGDERGANREYLAMRAAAEHGVPVPTIVLRGAVANRPILVTTLAAGTLASTVVQQDPHRAHLVGLAMGDALGHLHDVVAPEGLVSSQNAWIDRGGPSLAPIRSLLEAVPNTGRLLHLDYHPNNVLLVGDTVSGIIDWENTLAGPPHIDVARTRAIMNAARLGGVFPSAYNAAIDQLLDGVTEGHSRMVGQDPHPELSEAWGLAMTVDDLAGHLGKPGSWVTEAILSRLGDERDRLIAALKP